MRLLRCTNKRGAVATCTGEKSLFGQPYQNERSLAKPTRVTNFCDPTKSESARVAHRARLGLGPRHRLARAPALRLHTSTRVHSTLDAHAARMRASPATRTCTHTATCAHVKKARCVLDITGHWLIVGRPAADTSGMHTHCIALAIAAARDPHALPTRCACHPPPPTLSPYAER